MPCPNFAAGAAGISPLWLANRSWIRGGVLLAAIVLSSCARWPTQLRQSVPLIRGEAPRMEEEQNAAQPLPAEETVRLLVVHGDKLVENGREALAVAQYEKARSLQPDYPGLAHKLAVLYDHLAQDHKAALEYRRALEQQPNDPRLLNDFGYFHYQRGRYAEAEKYFRQALAVCETGDSHWSRPWKSTAPTSPKQESIRDRVCVNLGLTLAQLGRYQEAFAFFTKVLTPAQAHYNLAVVMLQKAGAAGMTSPGVMGHLPPQRQAELTQLQQQARFHLQQALQLDGSLRQARAVLNALDNPEPRTSPEPTAPTRSRSDSRPVGGEPSRSATPTAGYAARANRGSAGSNRTPSGTGDRSAPTSGTPPAGNVSTSPSPSGSAGWSGPVGQSATMATPDTSDPLLPANATTTGNALPTVPVTPNTAAYDPMLIPSGELPAVRVSPSDPGKPTSQAGNATSTPIFPGTPSSENASVPHKSALPSWRGRPPRPILSRDDD